MAVPYIPGAMVDLTRVRYAMIGDEYHNQVRAGLPDEVAILDCVVQPESGSETFTDGDRFTLRRVAYLPLEADVLGTDKIDVPGIGRFEIAGPVEEWPDVGGLGHKVAHLVRYKEEPS